MSAANGRASRETLDDPNAGDVAGFRPSAQGTLKMEDLIPFEYLLRIGDQRCACGEVYRHHELLLVYVHPEWTCSTKFRKLVPVERRDRPDLKVGTSFLQEKRIPLCVACLGDVQQPAPRPTVSDADWAKALQHEMELRKAATKPAAPRADYKPKVDIKKLEF